MKKKTNYKTTFTIDADEALLQIKELKQGIKQLTLLVKEFNKSLNHLKIKSKTTKI